MKITALGITRASKDINNEPVIRKVYEIEETFVTKKQIDTGVLNEKKAKLLLEVAEIDDMLSQMDD